MLALFQVDAQPRILRQYLVPAKPETSIVPLLARRLEVGGDVLV